MGSSIHLSLQSKHDPHVEAKPSARQKTNASRDFPTVGQLPQGFPGGGNGVQTLRLLPAGLLLITEPILLRPSVFTAGCAGQPAQGKLWPPDFTRESSREAEAATSPHGQVARELVLKFSGKLFPCHLPHARPSGLWSHVSSALLQSCSMICMTLVDRVLAPSFLYLLPGN